MAYLVALDDGHGLSPKPTSGKRTPNIPGIGVIYENQFNRAVVNFLDVELKRCGFRTILVAPTDIDTPLDQRVSVANRNGADAYVAVHYNAGGGSGVETYHFPNSTKGQRLARLVHAQVIKGTPQKDRGVKTANFYVLRKTSMPATLIEFGFMDDPGLIEAKRMIDPAFQKECAVETAKGVCQYFGVDYVPPTPTPTPLPFQRVEVDGKVLFDSQVVDTILDGVRKNLGKVISIKPR
ncbi:N-acetylmuramoyl-L-alanine amidase [Croceifilum oryzae]|uniref:N-acetylmuramoyl-L-alanine amidase n=1 Tax=Croceifilum oryzae TaxID=1553429 RepID=A0AAJ1TPK2_9BACL|nr:N-acetylmuramoyl-L-alanine amidase [Croceifilum oryzae]MDQ0418575.1 N-acetylmuramoyl-L-alanine amidase [Croceifilum oryzae]